MSDVLGPGTPQHRGHIYLIIKTTAFHIYVGQNVYIFNYWGSEGGGGVF